jgi:hypothetical protein
MSKTIVSETGFEFHLTRNGHYRDIVNVSHDDLQGWIPANEDDNYTGGFTYRGNVYALDEFERVVHPDFKTLGFDGISCQSAFDAILVKLGDDYDTLTVAHVHW